MSKYSLKKKEGTERKRKESIPSNVIDEIKFDLRNDNEIEFVSANIRNILFCGASRSGKTTCFKVFQDPCYCPDISSIFSETQSTTFKSFSLRNNKTKETHEFILNMIDSPGTFEIRSADSEFTARSNEQIGELIVECLNHEVTYLNLVVMFLTLAGRVTDRDVDSVELFMKMFGNCGMPIILCITHADKHNDKYRQSVEKEIVLYPRLKPYFDQNKLEVLWMGCVDHIHNDFYDTEVLVQNYQDVAEWRDIFLKRIFDAEKRYPINKTAIFQDRKESFKSLVTLCSSELAYLIKADRQTSEYQRRLATHKEKMSYLYKQKILLNDDLDVDKKDIDDFWDLIQTTKKSQIEKEKKIELIQPWKVD